MSSDEDLYEVEEILNQRKRKRGLEYLVRWKGYNELYDSWEPVAAVAHCTQLIKNFLAKKKSAQSKSRSRSRGRSGTKSRSRSRSRGRPPKSRSTRSRSRSRSASRTVAQPSASASISLKKEEASFANLEPSSLRSRRREQWSEQRSSADKAYMVLDKAATTREGATLKRKTKMVTRTVETVRSTPPKTHPVMAMPWSSLVVRKVQNDEMPASRGTSTSGSEKETWIWWFADYATLAVFILVSLCVLSYSFDSVSGVVPSASVLRQRLGESYDLLVQELSYVFNTLATMARAVYEGSGPYTDGYQNAMKGWWTEEQNQTVGWATI